MADLPSPEAFVGSSVTQSGFKEAQTQLIDFVGDLDVKIAATTAGHKGYTTLALAQSAQTTLPVNTIVEVTNDSNNANNGLYQWNGTTLTKSSYDPLTQAKEDATTKANAAEANAKTFASNVAYTATANIHQTEGANLHELTDKEGNVVASVNDKGEATAQDFKTEAGSLNQVASMVGLIDIHGTTHANIDNEGNILSVLGQDGSVTYSIKPASYGVGEIRAGVASNEVVNDIGLSIDSAITASDTPLKFTVTVSPFLADETRHQRMASAIKVGPNRLYVAFSQFSTMSTDQADGRLVGRFVDYDLKNQTATVSETIPIIGEKLGSLYRHPHFIQLKDRILMIFNGVINELLVYESFDRCQTWQPKTQIDCTPPLPWATAIDSAVLIEDGRYKGRIVLSLFRYSATEGLVGTVYSDDNGATWIRGQTLHGAELFPSYPSINETSVALDAQQNLLFVIRNEEATPEARYLIFAKSTDGGETVNIFEQTQRTPAIACQVGLKQTSPFIYDGLPRVIATCPTTGGGNREGFRLRISYDNCMSWAHEYKPFAETLRVGYSSVVPLGQNIFALVYEEGTMNASQSIKLTFFNLKEVI